MPSRQEVLEGLRVLSEEVLEGLRVLSEEVMESLRALFYMIFTLTKAVQPQQEMLEQDMTPIKLLINEVKSQRQKITELGEMISHSSGNGPSEGCLGAGRDGRGASLESRDGAKYFPADAPDEDPNDEHGSRTWFSHEDCRNPNIWAPCQSSHSTELIGKRSTGPASSHTANSGKLGIKEGDVGKEASWENLRMGLRTRCK